jgi:hypothetical protein
MMNRQSDCIACLPGRKGRGRSSNTQEHHISTTSRRCRGSGRQVNRPGGGWQWRVWTSHKPPEVHRGAASCSFDSGHGRSMARLLWRCTRSPPGVLPDQRPQHHHHLQQGTRSQDWRPGHFGQHGGHLRWDSCSGSLLQDTGAAVPCTDQGFLQPHGQPGERPGADGGQVKELSWPDWRWNTCSCCAATLVRCETTFPTWIRREEKIHLDPVIGEPV